MSRTEPESKPVVSIIIPNYNHAKYLPRRIDSILDQTFTNYEIIFMDDASTDNSVAVARDLLPKSARLILNKTNSRIPFKQWNKGVTEAKGEFIWIAESDDFADTTFLEKTVHILATNPRVGLAYTQSWLVDENEQTLCSLLTHTNDISPERWRHNYYNDGKAECLHYLCLRNTIPNASACLLRKSVYIQTGMAPTHLRQCGDWLHWITTLLISDVYYISEHLNYFRKHQKSVRASMEKSAEELVEVYSVLRFLRSKAALGPTEYEQSCRITFQRWRALSGPFKLSSTWMLNQLKVYLKAYFFDKKITRRILSHNFTRG